MTRDPTPAEQRLADLPDPLPEWTRTPGAVVLDRDGDAWQLQHGVHFAGHPTPPPEWRCAGTDLSCDSYRDLVYAHGPLTRLTAYDHDVQVQGYQGTVEQWQDDLRHGRWTR